MDGRAQAGSEVHRRARGPGLARIARMSHRLLALALVGACHIAAAPASAQVPLDRAVPKGASGQPLAMSGMWPQLVGSLARATGVPMGVEYVAPGVLPAAESLTLSGLTLREALDTMARVGGVHWREMDGVIVIRTEAAWLADAHPLELPVPSLRLDDAVAQQALAVACAMLGAADSPVTPERHRFSLSFPGGRLIDFLNSAVREHGSLSWGFARTPDMPDPWRVSVTLSSGSSGVGCGAPGVTPDAVDLAAFIGKRTVAKLPADDVLARPVGPNVHGGPLSLNGTFAAAVRDLATAARVPIGLEVVPGPPLIFKEGFAATGSPLHLVLDALVTVDPRYEWRLIDGVVVIRPQTAWADPASPLAARVDSVRLLDEPMGKLVQLAQRAVGAPTPSADFPDNRLVWVDLPPGTALDLLCAVVRAYGDLVWVFEELEPAEKKQSGLAHRMWLYAQAGGRGIPVR